MRTGPGARRGPVLAVAASVVLVLVLSARSVARVYTDYLWFDSLDYASVWRGLLATRIGLAAAFTGLLGVLVWVNLWLVDRRVVAFVPLGPREEAVARVRAQLRGHQGGLRLGVAAALALVLGSPAAGRWQEWILFRNAVDFGTTDPQFGRDVAFYVSRLPFLVFAADWLFAAVLTVTVVTAAAYYVSGGIRLRPDSIHIARHVRVHLSALLASLALVKAVNYHLDRFELNLSTRGVVTGASYTDVNAQLPALNLLIGISLLAAALFLANMRRRGWTLPVLAVGLWAFVAVLVAGAYPAFVQRFRVEPAESTREARFIERNIEATRAAMGLDDVEARPFAYDEDLGAEALVDNADTIRNVRLWDPRVLRRTYQRLQEVRTFYRFTDVDVDRYDVGDRLTQIVLSARELNPGSLPSDSWENRHLAFTHGYGAVLSPANAVTADGQPDFLVKNIPPQGRPAIDQPRLYHGEAIGGYAIVQTTRDEIDYLRDDGTAVPNRYDGRGGVRLSSYARRLAFALRFGDVNPLISGFVTDRSRILYLRDIRERVQALAPFLHYDHDPYPVVLEGRIVWIIDAYTTTAHHPYAQHAEGDRLEPASGLRHRLNYVRNSVKVVVDAYHGDVTLYLVDPTDPLAAAYARAFPRLFTPNEAVTPELRAHFRYPEDLFRVQTDMWGRYHIGDPGEFYSQSDRWSIAQDPGSAAPPSPAPPASPATTAPPGRPQPRGERRMDPYYLLTRLPGEETTEFLMLQPFVPFSDDDTRRELSAFMVARADPHSYGQLQVFVMPRDRQVDGPAIVNARINQEPEVSQLITLLSRAGSEVLQGNLVIIPVEQSLLYIRPLYVQATGANAVPELKKVIVVFGGRIGIRDTLQQALVAVFGDAPETLEEPPAGGVGQPPDDPASPGGVPDDVRALLEQAAAAFAQAESALRNGEFAAYERHIREARQAVERARQGGGDPSAPPVTATTSPGP